MYNPVYLLNETILIDGDSKLLKSYFNCNNNSYIGQKNILGTYTKVLYLTNEKSKRKNFKSISM